MLVNILECRSGFPPELYVAVGDIESNGWKWWFTDGTHEKKNVTAAPPRDLYVTCFLFEILLARHYPTQHTDFVVQFFSKCVGWLICQQYANISMNNQIKLQSTLPFNLSSISKQVDISWSRWLNNVWFINGCFQLYWFSPMKSFLNCCGGDNFKQPVDIAVFIDICFVYSSDM